MPSTAMLVLTLSQRSPMINALQGDTAWGGYATAIRAHERFVFPIPDGMPLDHAAPFLCAGLTVFSPMVRNGLG